MFYRLMKSWLEGAGFLVRRVNRPTSAIPDRELYAPYVNDWATFQPWLADPEIESLIGDLISAGRLTLVSRDRLWTLRRCLETTASLEGEVWEAGVYQGGTALLFKRVLARLSAADKPCQLRLFDTFGGMPDTRKDVDLHKPGDFSDTSLEGVRSLVGGEPWINYRPGLVPATFFGLEQNRIRFAHIDLDIYEAILSACEFIYPRLAAGGIMIFDDYGFWTCPGARKAVDTFFADKAEKPLVLPTGQAVMSKLP